MIKSNMSRQLAISIAVLASLPATTQAQQVFFVDDSATGSNSGSTWFSAFVSLQDGLAAAGFNNQVWVATGTYYPSSTLDRTASFVMVDEVAVYGGFAGTEASLDQRAGLFAQTILSGDLNNDDGPGFAGTLAGATHLLSWTDS